MKTSRRRAELLDPDLREQRNERYREEWRQDHLRRREIIDATDEEIDRIVWGEASVALPEPSTRAERARLRAVSERACEVCGRSPAADIRLRRMEPRFGVFRVHRFDGSLCRDCGQAAHRSYTNASLLRGWFVMFGFFWSAILSLGNLRAGRRLALLSEPQRHRVGQGRPLDAGDPLRWRLGPWQWIVTATIAPLLQLLVLAFVVGCVLLVLVHFDVIAITADVERFRPR